MACIFSSVVFKQQDPLAYDKMLIATEATFKIEFDSMMSDLK